MPERIKLGYHFLVSNSMYFILISIISAIMLHYDLNSIMVYYDYTRYYYNPAWVNYSCCYNIICCYSVLFYPASAGIPS
ncbi:hypothetical protein DsansV1_C26g0190651 [Dioscorea sansibarensis]